MKGSDNKIDWAVENIEKVNSFLKQGMNEGFSFDEIKKDMSEIFNEAEE